MFRVRLQLALIAAVSVLLLGACSLLQQPDDKGDHLDIQSKLFRTRCSRHAIFVWMRRRGSGSSGTVEQTWKRPRRKGWPARRAVSSRSSTSSRQSARWRLPTPLLSPRLSRPAAPSRAKTRARHAAKLSRGDRSGAGNG